MSNNRGSGGMWPILLFISITFWPSIFVHSEPAKTIADAIWYPLIGLTVMTLLGIHVYDKFRYRRIAGRIRRTEALMDRWDPPDLRKSGEFEGTWI